MEVKFFRLIIIFDGIKMNLKKIVQIKSWIKLKNGKDLKRIRRFIKDFIKIVCFLYNLLIKEFLGIWDDKCDGTFKGLKETVTTKPIMIYFNRTKKTFLKCDFSNLVSEGILS